MASLKVYNLDKQEVGSIELEDAWLKEELKPHLVKDVILAHLNSLRQGTHSTKGTSQVKGSTRKLFRQKGTGRARAGSRKAVQRRHGATQFGPRPRSYQVKVNKKVSRQVLFSVLAQAVASNRVTVFDSFIMDKPKTARMKKIMDDWGTKKALVVDEEAFDLNFVLSARNISDLKLVTQGWVNAYDLLKFKDLWISKQALQSLNSRYSR